MNWFGYAGLVMLGLALAVALLGVLASLPSALRLARTAGETRRLVAMYRQTVTMHGQELDQLIAEREDLLRPLGRVRRVVTHPLAIALFESYRRRRRRLPEGGM